MYITAREFLLCTHTRGYESIKGMEELEKEIELGGIDEEDFEKLFNDTEIFEKKDNDADEGEFIFSPLAQLYMDIMHEPDSWIRIKNRSMENERLIYVKDFYFVMVEMVDHFMNISLLPTIELMIGACASMWPQIAPNSEVTDPEKRWDGNNIICTIKGEYSNNSFELEICENGIVKTLLNDEKSYLPFSEEKCTNMITGWVLDKIYS